MSTTPKRERIRLLVTVEITHDGSKFDRRNAIAEARENVLLLSSPQVARPRSARLLEPDAIIMPKAIWDLARNNARKRRSSARGRRIDSCPA